MPHQVVVGALVRDGLLLLVHRRADRRHFPDRWDLPGGHVEADEPPTLALIRELREELGIEAIVSGASSFHLEHEPHENEGLLLDVWTVTEWRGEPANTAPEEHDGLRWVAAPDIAGIGLAHAASVEFLHGLLAPRR